jgi:hypothetical protein
MDVKIHTLAIESTVYDPAIQLTGMHTEVILFQIRSKMFTAAMVIPQPKPKYLPAGNKMIRLHLEIYVNICKYMHSTDCAAVKNG